MKDYNLNADVSYGFNCEIVYGKKSDFKDVDEFKRYLIGEEYADAQFINESNIQTVYMRYIPKGNFDSDYLPYYTECKTGKGATEYYKLNF